MRALTFILTLAIGLLWALLYRLGPAAAATVVGAHAALGIVLALVLPPLARRTSPASPRAAIALALLLALVIAPIVLHRVSELDMRWMERLALFGAGGAAGIVVALVIARFGTTAAVAAGVLACAATAATLPAEPRTLPTRKTVAAERGPSAVRRVAVIGIDGGDWRVIDPLIAAGEMPNLARLRARGVHGVLESIEPMYSPVVWTTIFSGKTPEHHGITGWYVSHAANSRASRLWRLLESAGMKSIVSNVPGTWPPRPLEAALVSGFPIPSPFAHPGGSSSLVGAVVSASDREGRVPTAVGTPTPDGGLVARVPLGDEPVKPRTPFRNAVMEWRGFQALLPTRPVEVSVRMGPPGPGGGRQVEIEGESFALEREGWTPWIGVDRAGADVRIRARLLADGDLYVTPAFQSSEDPEFWFTSSEEVLQLIQGSEPYVVEGAGWRAAADADVRAALYEHLEAVSQQRYDALLKLMEQTPDWDLLAFVFTLTDRVSHGFWRFHQPEEYAPIPAEELAADRSRVEDAYRWVDAHLGDLVSRMPPDTTILITSDHGFRADHESEDGTHRKEGIFVAAGPGIAPSEEPVHLSVLDVTPTVLAALRLPVANDMDGQARTDLFDSPLEVAFIETYEREGDSAQASKASALRIDPTTEEQLRSLGYIE